MNKERQYKLEHILNDWVYEAIPDTRKRICTSVGYEIKPFRRLIVYTNSPGYLIGKAGVYFYNLEDRLRDEGFRYKVGIKELGNGMFRRIYHWTLSRWLKRVFKKE